MSLATELNAKFAEFHANAPAELKEPVKKSMSDFIASYNLDDAIKVGDKLPEFHLQGASGDMVDSKQLLANGPILVTFYRGNWCPYCNITLRTYQQHLDTFKAKGVTFVAISPELPDQTLTMTEKHELKFPVLTDVGNKFAKKLGILCPQPDEMRPVYSAVNVDLKAHNGDDTYVVPLPAFLLVDQSGVVRNAFIDPNFTHRLEPTTALEWISALDN
ncbi:AhpC-TSA-domain-containing protein [Mollisia scopiformis]|uniref:thioredoxin-dependent peroxiredoxin n=1 Tax=Mollisia scopiformis TaxID=149040 RepID=A0A132BB78_MOLSC|nr:AhpC-TSA-domain-containing protein [Mollisia scopiformis]KUJ09641.1 AhpC-TSA-domain-containing protein [Mollisia scopiformis]